VQGMSSHFNAGGTSSVLGRKASSGWAHWYVQWRARGCVNEGVCDLDLG